MSRERERLYDRHEAARAARDRAIRKGAAPNIIEHHRRADRQIVDELTELNRQERAKQTEAGFRTR